MKRLHAYALILLIYTPPTQSLYMPACAQSDAAAKTLAYNSLPSALTPPIVRAATVPEGVKPSKRKVPPPRTPSMAHYQKAQAFKQKGDQSHEMIELIKSTQENPKFVKAYYELALIFRERGYFKLAQSTLEQVLAIKNDYSEARILLAALQLQQGNLGGAMSQLGQTIGISMPVDKTDPAQKDVPAASVLQSLHSPIPSKENSSKPRPGSGDGEKAPAGSTIKAFWIKPYPRLEEPAEEAVAAPNSVPSKTTQSMERSAPGHDLAEPNSFASLLHLKNPFSFFKRSDNTGKPPKARAKKNARTKEPKKPKKKKSHRWKFFDLSGRSGSPLASGEFIPKLPEPKTDTSKNLAPTALMAEPNVEPVPVYKPQTAVRQPAATGSSSMPRPFQAPDSVLSKSALFHAPQKVQEEEKPAGPTPYLDSDDPWSVRLRYLAEHGTSTLKEGEAFMFSEDSGEATLFLSDGKTVRRQIYVAKDSAEVIKERRPDILAPDDLMYNVSLLAKLMPRPTESTKQQNTLAPQMVPAAGMTQPPGTFGADNFLGKSQSFWGWIKGLLPL